ncbi:hypothetical protein M9458_045475, partial [Cirrhinus mrigala]
SSRCARFAPGELSLRRELSPACLAALVVGLANGSGGGNGDRPVPFFFLPHQIQRSHWDGSTLCRGECLTLHVSSSEEVDVED